MSSDVTTFMNLFYSKEVENRKKKCQFWVKFRIKMSILSENLQEKHQ